jgi:hypothetical protein
MFALLLTGGYSLVPVSCTHLNSLSFEWNARFSKRKVATRTFQSNTMDSSSIKELTNRPG